MVDPDGARLHRLLAQIAEAGHTAFGVGDPDLALVVLASTPYDVLMIADHAGPWRAGSLALALRVQLGADMPICVCLRDADARDDALRAPMSAALTLPITTRELVEALERMVSVPGTSQSMASVLSPTEPDRPIALAAG